MPRASSVCREHGCPHLTPCPAHPPRKPWAGSTRRQRLPRNWERTRQAVLTRDAHRCTLCGAPANEVDHRIPGDNHSMTNLQALCTPCHKAKTQAEAAKARRT